MLLYLVRQTGMSTYALFTFMSLFFGGLKDPMATPEGWDSGWCDTTPAVACKSTCFAASSLT